MRTLQKKVSLFVATGTVALGIGVYAVQQLAGEGGGDPVKESALRIQGSPPLVDNGMSPASPPPAPASRAEDVPKYLKILPEPPFLDTKPKKSLSLPQKISTSPPLRIESLANSVNPAEMKIPSDCVAGARPLGECNCFNEALGKVSLRLHPSQVCIDEETRRLGHRVILPSEGGRYEMMELSPDADLEFAAVQKAAETERQIRAEKKAEAKRQAEAEKLAEMQKRAEMERQAEMEAETGQAPEQVVEMPSKAQKAFDPAAEQKRLLAAQAEQIANILKANGRLLASNGPIQPGIAASSTPSAPSVPLLPFLPPPRSHGKCPSGSKNEGCRCHVFDHSRKEPADPKIPGDPRKPGDPKKPEEPKKPENPVRNKYIPAANPPEYCSSPEMQAVLYSDGSDYFTVWTRLQQATYKAWREEFDRRQEENRKRRNGNNK